MPSGHDWEGEVKNPHSVKEAIKRVVTLNRGLDGDLWKMAKQCHGDIPHTPMCFVRSEKSGEVYYVCAKCLSDYMVTKAKKAKDIIVLRGAQLLDKEVFKVHGDL